MSQFDMPTLDPQVDTGTQLADWLNSWQNALESLHSGATRPAYVKSGMLWLKTVSTTVWELTLYDGIDDVKLLTINPTANTVTYAGMGTAATKNAQTSVLDATAGVLMLMGGFGIGSTSGPGVGNLDSFALRTGIYKYTSGTDTGTPPVATSGIVLVLPTGFNAVQMFCRVSVDDLARVWFRHGRGGDTWGPWYEVAYGSGVTKQTGILDTTPTSVMSVGGFGLGTTDLNTQGATTANANAIAATGFYYASNAATNMPSGWPGGVLLNTKRANGDTQIALSTAGRMYTRSQVGSSATWTSWVTNWDTGNLTKQTSAYDGTAGRVMSVGAFGLGNTDMEDNPNDVNTIMTTGFYYVHGANMPTGLVGGMLLVMANTSSAVSQIIADISSTKVYARMRTGSAWSPWRSLGGEYRAWADVKASRALDATYTNNTAFDMEVNLSAITSQAGYVLLYLNGVVVYGSYALIGGSSAVRATVPPGGTYRAAMLSGSGSVNTWAELTQA